MVILTQSRDKIINFDKMDYIGVYNVYDVYAFKYDRPLCKIGGFETAKRAKDIIYDIYTSAKADCAYYYTPEK